MMNYLFENYSKNTYIPHTSLSGCLDAWEQFRHAALDELIVTSSTVTIHPMLYKNRPFIIYHKGVLCRAIPFRYLTGNSQKIGI